MRYTWNEIRAHAADFSREWEGARREEAESQNFWRDFFAVFGAKVHRVALYEHHVKKLSGAEGRIDLFWPGQLLVEQKSAGADLDAAFEQALGYLDGLAEHDLPRYVLVCDFQRFRLHDMEAPEGERERRFRLEELKDHVGLFGFITGAKAWEYRDEAPINIEAAERVGRLYDALKEQNGDSEELRRFLVRLVFCLFAEDTGIFSDMHAFETYIRARTRKDGDDLGSTIAHMFQVLDTPEKERGKGLHEDLAAFPYVNGDLFKESLRIPAFTGEMRDLLLEACEFDWSKVSPAIFGTLFQSVMEPDKRRAEGAHYTSESNILKVIGPLFMDDLRAEFQRLRRRKGGSRRGDLLNFQKRLGELNFLDPACGCGNFLVVACRELRLLELEVLRELFLKNGEQALDVSQLSRIRVSQFHGIEKEPFPARIAETSLWIMEHLMNRRLGEAFGQVLVRLPLEDSPRIRAVDALETDWNDVLPAKKCHFVLGNPPFVGASMQTPEQKSQLRAAVDLGKGKGGGVDYVCAWFLKAGDYIHEGKGRIGLVATNSITQGKQVGQLWPLLHERCGLEIAFAHRTFAWGSEARGAAKVHVVILGLVKRADAPDSARLFSYDGNGGGNGNGNGAHESRHAAVTPYLTDGSALSDPRLVVRESHRPMNDFPEMILGSKIVDGGCYTFTGEERRDFLREEPGAKKFLRPFVGAREFLHGERRWILALHKAKPEELLGLPKVQERVQRVIEARQASRKAATRALAEFPRLYESNVLPTSRFLVVPRVSSENREYLPIGWMKPPSVPGDATLIVQDADESLFALLSSAMHTAWLRYVGGRLKSDFRYSSEVVYNTFPVPPGWEKKRARLEAPAEAVLAARAEHPDTSLADLYNPGAMPTGLRRAHRALDRAVDRMYRAKGFGSERERVEHLLALYEKAAAPVVAKATPNGSRRAAKSRRRPKKA